MTALTLLLCSLAFLPNRPQGAVEVEGAPRFGRPTRIYIKSPNRSFVAADLDDGGEVETSQVGFSANLTMPVAPEYDFTLGLGYRQLEYDFSGAATSLIPGTNDPFDSFEEVTFRPGLRWYQTQSVVWQGTLLAESAREQGADFDDSVALGVMLARQEFQSPTLRWSVGAFFKEGLEDDDRFFPFVGFDWSFAEDWRLAVEGPGLDLTWQTSERVTTGLFIAYDGLTDYRLDGDSPGLGGVMVDKQVLLGTEVTFELSPSVKLTLGGGWAVGREIEVDDSTGSRVGRQEVDDTPFWGLRFKASF